MTRFAALLLLLPALLVAPVATPAEEGEKPDFESVAAEFRQRLAAASIDRRAGAAKLLDPGDPRALGLLALMLEDEHWAVRGAAARALGSIDHEALRAKMRLDLLADERPKVREGIAFALGLTPIEGDAAALVGALADEHWPVRRAAARSLGEIASREAIEALIERLDPGEHARVRTWAAWSLRTLTGQTHLGQSRGGWRRWWRAHRDDPALKPLRGDAEVVTRKLGGIKLETVTITREDRPEVDLLVLGRYGYRDEYLRPYLDELAWRVRLTYVRLPSLQELTGVSGYDGDGPIPRYPVSKLVRAFDGLRKELGKDRVAILSHGATGWIALRFAQRYPKRTHALILVNSWLDALGYSAAMSNMLLHGSREERFVAETLMNRNRVPRSPAAYRAISRILLTSSFTDPADLDAAAIWWSSYEPQGFSVVPDMRFGGRMKLETPTLFFFSQNHPLSGHLSRVRIRRHLPNSVIATMRRSRGHPYVEEPEEFLRIFDGFWAHHGVGQER
jgi:pimeloyl-ACP methyl ester carboxylesterase